MVTGDPNISPDIAAALSRLINEVSGKVSGLVSAIRSTFPTLSDLETSIDKVSELFGSSSKSVKDFANELYKFGEVTRGVSVAISKQTELSQKLRNVSQGVLQAITDVIQANQKQIAGIKTQTSHLVSVFSKLKDNIAIVPEISDLKASLQELNTIIEALSKGTAVSQDSIERLKNRLAELNNITGVASKNTTELVYYEEKSTQHRIKMAESLRDSFSNVVESIDSIISLNKKLKDEIDSALSPLKEYVTQFEPLTKYSPIVRELYDQITSKIGQLGKTMPVTGEAIRSLLEDIKKLGSIVSVVTAITKEYSKSTIEYVAHQVVTNAAFREFSERMALLPGPIRSIAMSLGKFTVTIGSFIQAIKSVHGIVKDSIAAFTNLAKTALGFSTLASIIASVVTLVYTLYQGLMRVASLTVETTKAFGMYSFAARDITEFTKKIVSSWYGLAYSAEKVIQSVAAVTNILTPVGTTLDDLAKSAEKTDAIVSFSLTIDRVARTFGTTAERLSEDLMRFSAYFGRNLSAIIEAGRKGAIDLLKQYTSFNRALLTRIRLTADEVIKTFGGVLERLMWVISEGGRDQLSYMIGIADAVKKAVTSVRGVLGATVEHTRVLMSQFAEMISGTTWETYAGILAATGRWTGTLDEMVHKALVTTPFEKARETARFFMDIAKTSAGLSQTWVAFVPQFREIIRRFPEEVDVLREAIERWVSRPEIDFRKALEESGASVEKVDEIMLTIDALGNPLQTIITLIRRMLDKLALIANAVASLARVPAGIRSVLGGKL